MAARVKQLGISYPVLISCMDGTCPVQDAFQIQFYPTMVLLDRQGRILRREQVATDVTLARIDRFIARNLRRSRREPRTLASWPRGGTRAVRRPSKIGVQLPLLDRTITVVGVFAFLPDLSLTSCLSLSPSDRIRISWPRPPSKMTLSRT